MKELSPAERERIGRTIKNFRELHGWKSGHFARAVGISHSYLSNIEAGRKAASMPVLRRIADTLPMELGAIVSADFLATKDGVA